MTPQEFTLCKEVLQYLTSSELTAKNYMFLEPVDTSIHTTYTQYVQRPMDLGTVTTFLNSSPQTSNYPTVDALFADILLCFENAVVFNSDKPEHRWIVKLAKEMIRITQREQKKMMKKLEDTNAAGKNSTKSVRQDSSSSLLLEDGEIKTLEVESQKMSTDSTHRKEENLSAVVKPNKSQRQSKVKITLPLSKNAPASKNPSTATNDIADTSKKSIPTSRGKQMLTDTNHAAPLPTSTTTGSQPPPPPKIRLSLGAGGGGGRKSTTTSSLQTNQNKGQTDLEVQDQGDSSTTKQVGRLQTNPSVQSSKTLKKLPLQSKSSDPASHTTITTTQSSSMDLGSAFSLGISISQVDDLFTTVFTISSVPMTRVPREQCYKVLSGLIRRNSSHAHWFLKPVSDPRLIDDYKAKIPTPMDLGTIGTKLDKNQYKTVADFVMDIRRVFANCLRYNSEAANPLRVVAREMLISAEALMIFFLNFEGEHVLPYPQLLSCWRNVVDALDYLLTLTTSNSDLIAHYFLHPPSYYFGGAYPKDYLEKISTPMDLGTITSKLIEGSYQKVDDIIRDVELIHSNCSLYYMDKDGPERENAKIMIGQAQKVGQILRGKIQPLLNLDRSVRGSKNLVDIKKPPKSILHRVLTELRATTFTDKFTKSSERATLQFEEPVDTSVFKDYLQYVETPINLSSIDRKIEADGYGTPEDFEYDVNLIFKNCEVYNVPKKNTHIVALARHCMKTFRKHFESLVSSWEVSPKKRVVEGETAVSLSRSIDLGTAPLSKKIKLERGLKPRKSLPPIHLASNTATTLTTIPRPTANLKSINKVNVARENAPRIRIKLDGPIPLHVAIAQIKDSFSSRRLHKDLESWEGACSRFYRELMRHPWLSAARPKFIFSCPVPILYPELKELYSAKIVRPMDLTTIECKLLQGGLYKSPQDMADDVALVFSNAVTFNKAGYEEGEPLSCAYYDASRHLLRFSRWLSLECFDQYLIDDMHDDGAKQVGPIPSWKLRRSYWKDAKEEMEDIVFNQVIERSDDGRSTWMESECEKLLKCLRHQSDCKRMELFLESTYPVDYFAKIAKPMDWKSCERALQQRKYKTFGEIVGDLRLIFSNAVTYNGPVKAANPVSGLAYDAALYMSSKLEAYISKMLITVSDRILRERIDETILGREQQAAERAEVTRLRNEWQQQRERSISVSLDHANDRSKSATARELSYAYYDDEPPNHDVAQPDLTSQHRFLLEKQLADRVKMLRASADLGNKVYQSMVQRSKAIAWAQSLASDMKEKGSIVEADVASGPCRIPLEPALEQAQYGVLSNISTQDRPPIKMKLSSHAKSKVCKVMKRPSLFHG